MDVVEHENGRFRGEQKPFRNLARGRAAAAANRPIGSWLRYPRAGSQAMPMRSAARRRSVGLQDEEEEVQQQEQEQELA